LYQGFAKAREGPFGLASSTGQNLTLATRPCRPIYERLLSTLNRP
jgi:hypothetical protein